MRTARYLTLDERERLLGAMESTRDRLLVVLGLNTGFRAAELLSLRWHQIWRDGQPLGEVQIARRHLKGGRSRHRKSIRSRAMALNDAAARAIRDHAFATAGSGNPPSEGFVFASRKRFPGVIDRRRAHEILVRAARRAGLQEGISTHSLRRSFGRSIMELAERAAPGRGVLAAQQALAHQKITTSQLYLRLADEEVKSLVRQLGAQSLGVVPSATNSVALGYEHLSPTTSAGRGV